MRTRRRARESVLQALYQCDTLNDWSNACCELYFKQFQQDLFERNLVGGLDKVGHDNLTFCRDLLFGVVAYLEAIDQAINRASQHWSIARMSRIDRNIIRLGAYELGFVADIPNSVSLNEAIEIAKLYGSDDSPMFVNGVLDRVASNFVKDPEYAQNAISALNDKKAAVA